VYKVKGRMRGERFIEEKIIVIVRVAVPARSWDI